MVPRQSSFHVALLVKLLVIGLGFLLEQKFDSFAICNGGLSKVFLGLMAISYAEVTAQRVFSVKLDVLFEVLQRI